MMRVGPLQGILIAAICLALCRLLIGRLHQTSWRLQLARGGVISALGAVVAGFCPAWVHVPLPAALHSARPLHVQPVSLGATEDLRDLDSDTLPAFYVMNATPSGINWVALLGSVYALGAIVTACYWLMGYRGLRRLLAESDACPARVFECLLELGVSHPPRVRLSRRCHAPCCFGVFLPTILLPLGIGLESNMRQLRWLLAHEMSHLDRRDPWTHGLFVAASVLFYPMPWFWKLWRETCLNQEFVADASAIAAGADAAEYASLLVSFAQSPNLAVCANGVVDHSSDLTRRITMVLQSGLSMRKCPKWAAYAMTGSLALLCTVGTGLAWEQRELRTGLVASEARANISAAEIFEDESQAQQPESSNSKFFRPLEAGLEGLSGNQLLPAMENMRLGIQVGKPSAALASQLGLEDGVGLVVERVNPKSVAATAGFKEHDIIVMFDGKTVSGTAEEFAKSIRKASAGKPLEVVVLRRGNKVTISDIKLPEVKEEQKQKWTERVPIQGHEGGPIRKWTVVPGQQPEWSNHPNFQPFQGLWNQGQIQTPAWGGMQGLGGLGGVMIGSGQGIMISSFRSNDNYTTRHQEGSLIITVTGTVKDGKSSLSQITVQDGNQTSKYESADKIPEQYRDKVKNLLEMSEKNSIRIEVPEGVAPKKPTAKPGKDSRIS